VWLGAGAFRPLTPGFRCIYSQLGAYTLIQTAVPTDPFSSPCACSRLRRAARAITQLYDDALAPVGLRVTQLALLRALQRQGRMRIGELAAQSLLDRTALSRNLDPLAARKLVTVEPGRDARTREVMLTRQGIAALAAASPHWEKAQRDVARHIGRERLDGLYDVLRDMESLHPMPTSGAD
jgi:DNA-binding MarR family transcriptional regulator